jgi:ABC-type transport system involved in cytochrome bd biosynthesis, ATPase and permease components
MNRGQNISLNLEKVLDNLFLIKILKLVKSEVTNFSKSLNQFYTSRINDIKVGTINTLLPNFFTMFALSIALVFFDFMKFITFDFIGILLRLFQSLGILNKNIHTVSAFHVYLEKLYEIEINKETVSSDSFLFDSTLDSSSAICLEKVSFKYLGATEIMFEDLDLVFPRNKHTIITGPNGSGKSTLLGLISGIFYPTKGQIKVSSNKFGYISASPMILNSTLRENILYGSDKTDLDSEIINLIEEFKVFNEEYEVDLERKISNKMLSTGQMQKISFIRALISGSEILILDESTSNLDLISKKLFLLF